MSEVPKSELASQAADIGKVQASDHVANILKAALNAVPVVGGSFASLIDDYIPENRQKRLEKFTKEVACELERITSKLNNDYVKTDEFAFLFTRTYRSVATEYQESKLQAYRNILINSLVVDIDSSIKEQYLNLLDRLTDMHLKILSAFCSDEQNSKTYRKLGQAHVSSVAQAIILLAPGIPDDMMESCLFDLDQMGLTRDLRISLNTSDGTPEDQALEKFLTPIGKGFLRFIASA